MVDLLGGTVRVDESLQKCFVLHNLSSLLNMSDKQQRLVLSIIEFLTQSIQDGTVSEDDKEGLEVAGKQEYHVCSSCSL